MGDALGCNGWGGLAVVVVARCGRRRVFVLQTWTPTWTGWRVFVYEVSVRDVLERDLLAVAEGQDPVMSFTLKQLPGREPLRIFDISRELYHASVLENCTNGDEHPVTAFPDHVKPNRRRQRKGTFDRVRVVW